MASKDKDFDENMTDRAPSFKKAVFIYDTPIGSDLKILIVHSRWHFPVIESMVNAAWDSLIFKHKVKEANLTVRSVAGSYELAYAAKRLGKDYDAVICIGILVKGETHHFEYISQAVSQGIMNASLQIDTPIIFGVLTVDNLRQAMDRAGFDNTKYSNRAVEWASTAVEMGMLKTKGVEFQDPPPY